MLIMSSAVSVNALVFSGGEVWNEDEPDAQANAVLQTLAQSEPGPWSAKTGEVRRPDGDYSVSTYVRVFEGAYSPRDSVGYTHILPDMVGTVIKEEKHLLNDEELALLTVFAHLSCTLIYLLLRLILLTRER
jgi:hypothetical protein